LECQRLTPSREQDVWRIRRAVVRIEKSGAAPHLLIGRDREGRRIGLPIEATADPTVGRPIPGWYREDAKAAIIRAAIERADRMTSDSPFDAQGRRAG
jgi:hypothetical protein